MRREQTDMLRIDETVKFYIKLFQLHVICEDAN